MVTIEKILEEGYLWLHYMLKFKIHQNKTKGDVTQ